MENTATFKLKIFLVALIVAAVAFIVSLFFIGFNKEFVFGLAGGTGVAILNFNIMAFWASMALEKKSILINILGYIIRFAIYGGFFYLAVINSYKMAFGCGIGFFTIQIAIFYLFALRPQFEKKKN